MANKALFSSSLVPPVADTTNKAGGAAYKFSPEHALAQLAVTGTFNNTFYGSADEQLEKLLGLLPQVSTEFIAKLAVFGRERGQMKDMPAALVAYLAAKDIKLGEKVFPRVIDSGKMLRNFVQFVRSGKFGRKSLGSAPKRWVQHWFSVRDGETIFRQSLGNSPSMADVIKLARPKPENKEKEALYAYLLQAKGHEGKFKDLPVLVRDFEHYKRNAAFGMPNVPFEMLTSLPLTGEEWKRLAQKMSWTQLRMNLNTLKRHGVFEDPAMIRFVANRLKDERLVRKANPFPYQLMATALATKSQNSETSSEISSAIEAALEISLESVPEISGKIVVCPDVSGSMSSPITGHRKGSTTVVRCIDVAGLTAAALLRKNPTATILPFDTEIHEGSLNTGSVLATAEKLASFGGGGTACQLPLQTMNQKGIKADLVIYVSDNESWSQFDNRGSGMYGSWPTEMAAQWAVFKQRNPQAKMVLIDIQPYDTTQVHESSDVLNIGGFSDTVFGMISLFAKGELSPEHWVGEIEKISL